MAVEERGGTGLSGRIVVVSPHLDDAALCIGASIARAARAGADVRVVTVFAGDPSSQAPAARWDRACGFLTAGEASRGRREEDRRACAALGCQASWLPFGDAQYERGGNDEEVWAVLEPQFAGADVVLVPGFPLMNADHAWLTELVTNRLDGDTSLGFFVEQPYAWRTRQTPLDGSSPVGERPVRWTRQAVRLRDRHAKGKACRAYRSQFWGRSHLLRRFLVPEILLTDEVLGWPRPSSSGP